MKFQLAEAVFGLPMRLVSNGGRWELGYAPATFGRWQVTLGEVGGMSIELRYCCGTCRALRLEVLALVLSILEPLDEATFCYADIRRIFPKWTQRPIDLDPTCLPRLRELAEAASEPISSPAAASARPHAGTIHQDAQDTEYAQG